MRALFILLALVNTSWAAAGIPLNTPFDIPLVGVESGTGKAVIVESATVSKPMYVFYVEAGKLQVLNYTVTRGSSPSPGPGPEPQPEPQPEPLPVPTALYGVIVEETATRTPEQAIVITSKVVRALFDGGDMLVVDKDAEPVADVAPYLERAKGKPLPQFYLVDEAGAVRFEGALPATVSAMVALVESHRSK